MHGGYPGKTIVLLKYHRVSPKSRQGCVHYTASAKGGRPQVLAEAGRWHLKQRPIAGIRNGG
jgi:hypothetical protein